MPIFEAKVRYIDVRVITVEADTLEEAQSKYATGNFADETTVDFYSDAEIQPLRLVSEE